MISELLHESPVLELQCRTSDTKFNASYNGSAEHHDELTILYADSLISLDGFSLFQTLRACRSQLAVGKELFCVTIALQKLHFELYRFS